MVNINRHTITVGVLGTGSGVGTTHLSIMITIFLSMVLGNRVAFVEMNSKGCIRQAEIIRSNIDKHNNKIFNKKVSILTQSDISDISEIVSSDYDYVIIDYGEEYDVYKQLFLLNNIKLIVGNLSWWKLQTYVSFMANTECDSTRKNWKYLGNNISDKTVKYMRKAFGISIKEIPYEPDPFYLSGDTIGFLSELTSLW